MKWPIRTRAPFLLTMSHAGTCTATKLAIGSDDHRIEPNPIEPVCGYLVRHGLTWDSMGKLGPSKTFPSLLRPSRKNCPFPQILTEGWPIQPKAILYHEDIRFSFLWTTLWKVRRALKRN